MGAAAGIEEWPFLSQGNRITIEPGNADGIGALRIGVRPSFLEMLYPRCVTVRIDALSPVNRSAVKRPVA